MWQHEWDDIESDFAIECRQKCVQQHQGVALCVGSRCPCEVMMRRRLRQRHITIELGRKTLDRAVLTIVSCVSTSPATTNLLNPSAVDEWMIMLIFHAGAADNLGQIDTPGHHVLSVVIARCRTPSLLTPVGGMS